MTDRPNVQSRRNWLVSSSAALAAAWVGCGRSDSLGEPRGKAPRSRIPQIEGALDKPRYTYAEAPREKIRYAWYQIDRLLFDVYAQSLPQRFPNWIAFHALLMYGSSAYEKHASGRSDSNLQRVFNIVLNSNTKELGPYVVRDSLPYPRHSGPYFSQEHHPGQFLYYFSMGGGGKDAEIRVDGQAFAIQELLKRSMLETRAVGEMAFLVLAYSYFLEPGTRWKNKFGETMSLGILLEQLLRAPEKTCLGTHRLAALARTYSRSELRHGAEIGKLWPDLVRQVEAALADLRSSLNEEGRFAVPGIAPGSTSPGYQQIFYGGHSLEWITFLSDSVIKEQWVVSAITALVEGIGITYSRTYENLDAVGDETAYFNFDGLAHAVSALRRWRDRAAPLIV